MILAAGRGTRLAPLTDTVPKPMLELAGTPLIGHQVQALARAGIQRIIINLHHLGDQIETYLGNGSNFGVSIEYSKESTLLETGGGIARALPFFNNQPFCLLNGDIFTNFDFSTLPPAPHPPHRAHIVLTPTPDHRASGDFAYTQGTVTSRGEPYVYCGIAVLLPELFQAYAGGTAFSFREIMFALIHQQQLGAQIFNGIWQDIGSIEQYRAAQTTAATLADDRQPKI